MARLCAGFFFSCALVLATGCAQLVPQTVQLRTAWPEGVPPSVMLDKVPFFPQDDFQCGPAALATALAYTGVPITPEPLVREVYLPSRQGSLQVEMLAAPRRHDRVSMQIPARYGDLLREVAAGNPVIVLQDVGPLLPQWHYAVVNGFDYPSGTLYLRSGTKPRLEMPFTAFEREWMKGKYWAMVVTPPDRIPVTATEQSWMNAVLAMSRTASTAASTTAYKTALARWPDSLTAAIALANQHHTAGHLVQAVDVLREAQRRHPESVIVANNLAQALSDLGRNAEALALIDKASQLQSPFANDVKATKQLIEQRIAQQRAVNRR